MKTIWKYNNNNKKLIITGNVHQCGAQMCIVALNSPSPPIFYMQLIVAIPLSSKPISLTRTLVVWHLVHTLFEELSTMTSWNFAFKLHTIYIGDFLSFFPSQQTLYLHTSTISAFFLVCLSFAMFILPEPPFLHDANFGFFLSFL